MKKFYILALVAMMFAACTTDETQDLRPVDAPETLTVGFEGSEDNTRVQLNSAGKTVWTEGDLVSVFYRSDANQKWQFQGETGERTGLLKRVSTPEATMQLSDVVVAYPYSEEYYINPKTCNIQAYLPATQSYLKDSFGLDGNLMVSAGEYNQIYLKNVCGWLKLQLTGNGEMVQSITLKGNNGEQVAGSIYVDTETATATLAAETNGGYEDGVGGTLVFDDAILTEVTLNCGNGVELGAEPTAFYIALPPQTFEKGLTVEIETTEGKIMGQYTDKEIVIERNTIQPMAALEFEEKIAANQIHYTSSDDTVVTPYKTDVFGANIVSNTYDKEAGYGTITFDGKVTSIGQNAFFNCSSLTSITIPDSVIKIGESAFHSTSLECFNIPYSVIHIGLGAFRGCDSLTSITIPDSVTSIGGYAFANCPSLTSVTIGNGVTTIRDFTFMDCPSLTSITIPNSVISIFEAAFISCTSLTNVTIPNSVRTIRARAFQGCTSLTAFYGQFASEDNRCLVVNGVLNSFAPAGITSYTIPDSVTSIGNRAFFYCTSLTNVTIPDSVTSIGKEVFYGCSSLTRVTIPDSVNEIGEGAFSNCTSLKSVDIPESVTSIGSSAFYGCSSLINITIPDSVNSIGDAAFSNCSSLKAFYGKFASEDHRCLIVDGRLISFAIGCGINEYIISNNVTSVGSNAFSGYTSLMGITIPESVTFIGHYAFSYCTSLKEVYCKPTTPPTVKFLYGNWSAFYNNASGCKIYVPASDDDSIINAYKIADGWSDYASYIEEYDFSAGQ